jgi:hypothetical protein
MPGVERLPCRNLGHQNFVIHIYPSKEMFLWTEMSVNDMITQQVMMQSRRVTTEGDELYYEVRGQGQPLLMIPGGGGDGGSYSAVADILLDEFKVITYDRRANARSTMNDPQNFEISQQSRDAVAVLRAANETSAFVFGRALQNSYANHQGSGRPERGLFCHLGSGGHDLSA